MTNAQHLIENAIMHLCRTGKLLEADVNESHCSCTLEDANDMAQHIVWSLYNGLSPNDVDRLQEERDAAVADLKEISYCCNCEQCTDRDGGDIWCSAYGDWFEWYDTCDEWQWRGLSLVEKISDKEEKE